jgi:hypothetical protein
MRRSDIRITLVILLAFFLLAWTVCYAASAEQSEIIQLTNPEDIRHASTMDRAIVSLSNKVTDCARRKLAPAAKCFCLYPQELSHVRNTYEDTLRQHPDWKNKTVSYTTLEGRTYAVSFDGLSRQLQTKCR